METEVISVLQKSQIKKEVKIEKAATGCCGGAPVSTENACCKLDEDKKAEGEEGCGCNTEPKNNGSSDCC